VVALPARKPPFRLFHRKIKCIEARTKNKSPILFSDDTRNLKKTSSAHQSRYSSKPVCNPARSNQQWYASALFLACLFMPSSGGRQNSRCCCVTCFCSWPLTCSPKSKTKEVVTASTSTHTRSSSIAVIEQRKRNPPSSRALKWQSQLYNHITSHLHSHQSQPHTHSPADFFWITPYSIPHSTPHHITFLLFYSTCKITTRRQTWQALIPVPTTRRPPQTTKKHSPCSTSAATSAWP